MEALKGLGGLEVVVLVVALLALVGLALLYSERGRTKVVGKPPNSIVLLPMVDQRKMGEPRTQNWAMRSRQQAARDEWLSEQGIGVEHEPGSVGSQDDRTVFAAGDGATQDGKRVAY